MALGRSATRKATKPISTSSRATVIARIRGNAIFALGDIGDRLRSSRCGASPSRANDAALRTVAQDAMRKIRERPAPEVVPSALAQERQRARAAAGKDP